MSNEHAEAKEILAQHHRLDEIMNRLTRTVSGEFDWFEVDLELTHLDRIVTRHFELEEEGGYMNEVRAKNPNLAAQIEKGLAEHRRLAEALRELRRLALDREDRKEVSRKLFAWMDMVGKHEHFENQMVQEVFGLDIGDRD